MSLRWQRTATAHAATVQVRDDVFLGSHMSLRIVDYAGEIARTRSGLPLPSTIFSGAAMITVPVAGN